MLLSLLLTLACSPATSGVGSVTGTGSTDTGVTTTTDSTGTATGTPWDDTHLADIQITLDPDDWDSLRMQSRNIVEVLSGDCQAGPIDSPYTWFIGDVTIDGVDYSQVEVRKKGLVGSASTTKPGMRLDFDDHVDGQTYLGAEHLTLNNGVQDSSLVHQCLAYGLFADAGLPASRCAFVRVSVNDEALGVYVSVEPVKKPMLERTFGDGTGALFEGTLSDFRDGWANTFDPDTDAADTDRSAIDGLVDALTATDADLMASLDPVLDVDAFQTYRAMEALVGQWDGYTGNTNNFFIYQRPSDRRVVFVPWGIDAAFSQIDFNGDGQAHVYTHAALPLRIHALSDVADDYEATLVDLIDNTWDEERLLARVDRWSLLIGDHVSDPASWADGIDSVRDFIADQPGTLLAELDAGGADLSDDALAGSPCLVEHGSISATFSTTWGSSDSGDWWDSGTADLSASWDGQPIPIIQTSSLVGWADGSSSDVSSSDGGVLLGVLGAVDSETLLLPYFILPEELLASGATLDIDWNQLEAYLGYQAPGVDFSTAAYLYGGQLILDQAGTTAGDAVTGSFSSTLWGGSE